MDRMGLLNDDPSLKQRMELVLEEFTLHKQLTTWLEQHSSSPYVSIQTLVTTLATLAVEHNADGSDASHALIQEALVTKLRTMMDGLQSKRRASQTPGPRERKLARELAASLGVPVPQEESRERTRSEARNRESLTALVQAAQRILKERAGD